jgi:hypothetical protein
MIADPTLHPPIAPITVPAIATLKPNALPTYAPMSAPTPAKASAVADNSTRELLSDRVSSRPEGRAFARDDLRSLRSPPFLPVDAAAAFRPHPDAFALICLSHHKLDLRRAKAGKIIRAA